jgi:hypothetical protein
MGGHAPEVVAQHRPDVRHDRLDVALVLGAQRRHRLPPAMLRGGAHAARWARIAAARGEIACELAFLGALLEREAGRDGSRRGDQAGDPAGHEEQHGVAAFLPPCVAAPRFGRGRGRPEAVLGLGCASRV